jgi:hypothetical protein
VILVAVLGVVALRGETNLCCEVFDYQFASRLAREPAEFCEVDFKAKLSAGGVTWPDGSRVYEMNPRDRKARRVAIVNTPENLDRCRNHLFDRCRSDRQLEVRYEAWAFPSEEVEKIRADGVVDKEKLLTVRKLGRAKLVNSALAAARIGGEASVRNCTELMFPAEFNQVAITNQGTANVFLLPSDSQVREVGTILKFNSEFEEDGGQIHLFVCPQWVSVSRWETVEEKVDGGPEKKVRTFKRPIFRNVSLQTSLTMFPGESIMLEGGQYPEDGKMILYHFIEAKLVANGDALIKRGSE